MSNLLIIKLMAKRIAIVVLLLIYLSSCEGEKANMHRATFYFEADTTAYVLTRIGKKGEFIQIDTVESHGGKVSFKNIEPGWYRLYQAGEKASFPLFVENTDITINGQFDAPHKSKVTGSKAQSDYNIITSKWKKRREKVNTFIQRRDAAIKDGDSTKIKLETESLNIVWKDYLEYSDSLIDDYIMNNPSSILSGFYIWSNSYRNTPKDIKKIEKWLKNIELDSVPSILYVKDLIANMKSTDLGRIASDFTQSNPAGELVTLSDVYTKHEFTLIDFWASWCGPCRAEYPHLIECYKKYAAKGFTILGVSLDSKKEHWLKAIEEEHLNWINVSDLKGSKNEAALLYGVTGIPANFLVNKNGEIVAKDLRQEELDVMLKKVFDSL